MVSMASEPGVVESNQGVEQLQQKQPIQAKVCNATTRSTTTNDDATTTADATTTNDDATATSNATKQWYSKTSS